MCKKIFLLAAAIFTAPLAFAQHTFSAPSADSSANKKTTIIVTDSNAGEYFGSQRGKTQGRPPQTLHTSVKLNPLLVVNGDMPVYVERLISEKLTAEVSLGVTYFNPMISAYETNYYPDYLLKQDDMGYSFSAGLRYYPSNSYETMEGYYFTPEFRHRVYKATATEFMTMPIDIKQSRNVSEFRLMFGYTNFFEDHIFYDVYAGIGMRSNTYRNMIKDGGNIFNDATQTFEPSFTTYTDSNKIPALALGVKIGFAF